MYVLCLPTTTNLWHIQGITCTTLNLVMKYMGTAQLYVIYHTYILNMYMGFYNTHGHLQVCYMDFYMIYHILKHTRTLCTLCHVRNMGCIYNPVTWITYIISLGYVSIIKSKAWYQHFYTLIIIFFKDIPVIFFQSEVSKWKVINWKLLH